MFILILRETLPGRRGSKGWGYWDGRAARSRAWGPLVSTVRKQGRVSAGVWLTLRGGTTHIQGGCSHLSLAFLETSSPTQPGCFHGDSNSGLVGSEDIKVWEP